MEAHIHRAPPGRAGVQVGSAVPWGVEEKQLCLQVITLIRDVRTAFTVSQAQLLQSKGLSIYTHSPSLQLFSSPPWKT